MRKLICTLMSVCMAVAFMVPAGALADEATDTSTTGTDEFDSYASQSFIDLNAAGKLTLPSTVTKVEESEMGAGILVTLPKEYAGEKFTVEQEFSFGEDQVTYFSIEGLGERNTDVEVSFYLDDETEAFTTATLKRTSGKVEWIAEGESAVHVPSALTGGPHKLSFSFNAVSSKKRQVLLRSFSFMRQDLPLVELDIDEQYGSIDEMNTSSDHTAECYGNMVLHVPAGYESDYGDFKTTDEQTSTYPLEYIRGRGNSTWDADKKPYKIKLDSKADLLGMGENKHWALIANRYDCSLIRNKMTYWIGEQLGMLYTPQCSFVDVVMNGDYLGSYYLSEVVRVDDSRIEIEELGNKSTDISGGYLLNMGSGENFSFETKHGQTFSTESPDLPEEVSGAQADQAGYIKNYVQQMEDAIYGAGFKNAAGKSYTDYMDVDAAVDYYWIQMLSLNGDAYGGGSTYAFKNRDGLANDKFTWGPLWDFDYVAWGNLEYENIQIEDMTIGSTPWLLRLLQDEENFAPKMKARWNDIKAVLNDVTCEGGKLDQWEAQLAISQYNDKAQWGSYRPAEVNETAAPTTYSGEIEQLRNWITARVNWIDSNLDTLDPAPATITFKDGGKVVSVVNTVVNAPVESLPELEPRDGYYFAGWFDAADPEYQISVGDTYLEAEQTFVAKWIKNSEVRFPQIVNFAQHSVWIALGTDGENIPKDVFPTDVDNDTLTWTSSDESVATVDEYGTIEPKKLGTTTITATAVGGAHDSATVTIYEPMTEDASGRFQDFEIDEVTIPVGGAAVIPCRFTDEKCQLISISWGCLDASVAEVSSTGLVAGLSVGTTYVIGCNYGELETADSCKVNVVSNNLKNAKVKLGKTKFAYTGKAVKPAVKSVKIGGLSLTEGTDYTISYAKGRKNVGTYSVTLKGKGSFTGKKMVKFQVVPATAKLLTAKKSGNKVTAKWKKFAGKKAKQITGWQVMTASNKKFTKNKKTVTVTKKKAKTAVKKAGKKTFVKVRAYKTVKGKKIYGAWSNVKKA